MCCNSSQPACIVASARVNAGTWPLIRSPREWAWRTVSSTHSGLKAL